MKKTICMIEISGKGGICHYTYNLCNKLGKKMRILLITSKNYELANFERSFQIIGIFNRFKTPPLCLLKIVKIIKTEKPIFIHFQLSQYPAFILFLCFFLKIFYKTKIVITAHNIISHEEKCYLRFIFRKLYQIADIIIVHAKSNKLELLNLINLSKTKIKVIPHGNYMFFNQKSNSQLTKQDVYFNSKNDTPQILFFGYIRKYKGLIILIRAMAEVLKEIPNVKLIIAGKPIESFNPYYQEIKKLNLFNNVLLDLNYIPFENVKKYFQQCNVVVMPYIKIYQSGVLQLAYGFGKPVIATSCGGLPEVVEAGKSGLIIRPGNVSELTTSIKKILRDPELGLKMGKYALHLAKTKYSWETIAKQTFNIYMQN